MAIGKCPKCDNIITRAIVDSIDVKGERIWKGVAYLCPSCHCILSVEVDPLALKNDLVVEVVNELMKRVHRD